MKTDRYLKQKIKNVDGSLLVIGELGDNIESYITSNQKITETYWLNSNSIDDLTDDEAIDIGKDISLNKLRNYLKQGIDNVICDYSEIKNHIPEFIKESLNVTKKNLYLFTKKGDKYKKLLKKFKRYKLNYTIEELEDGNVIVIEINDIIVNRFKEKYYYFIDQVEKYYDKISDSI